MAFALVKYSPPSFYTFGGGGWGREKTQFRVTLGSVGCEL